MTQFAIVDVLAVTAGRLLQEGGMEGVYKVVSHVIGREVYTHELPNEMRIAAEEIMMQQPQLIAATSRASTLSADEIPAWLNEMERAYGETLEINPIA